MATDTENIYNCSSCHKEPILLKSLDKLYKLYIYGLAYILLPLKYLIREIN